MHIRSAGTYCLTSAVLLMLFVSCGNQEQSQPKAPAKEITGELYTVEIKNMKFTPDSIVVHPGDKIIFVNRDLVDHCVTERDSAWTTSLIPSGEDHMVTVQKSCNYYCAIHKVMKGKIIVLPK